MSGPERTRRLPPALAAAGIGAGAVALLLLAGLAIDDWPFGLDRAIMLGLRRPDDLAVPIGPVWLLKAMRDVTALGSVTVLTMVVAATAAVLLAAGRRLTALLTVAATLSGAIAVSLFKLRVGRARPGIVPHLVDAGGMSFPSGHSTSSACVYLTLAALATQIAPGRGARRAIVVIAVLLVGMIGISRVYLGVHWPSDVMAGWSFGTLWALGWWRLGAGARAAVPRGGNA